MAFDPNQPFEVVGEEPQKPAFDPSQPFEAAAEAPAAPAAAQEKPAFDPAQSFEPVAAGDHGFWHQTANAVRSMEGALGKTYATAEAFGKNVWGNLSDQLFGTNIGVPERAPNPEQELKGYDSALATKQQMLAALPPDHPDTERLKNEVAGLQADRNNFIASRNAKSELYTNAYTDLHNTLANIDPQFGIDPNLKDTVPAQTGAAVGSLIPAFVPGVGTEAFLITSGLTKWGETYDKTGDVAAADKELAKDVGKNVLFIGAAHGANSQLSKALAATPGVSALQSAAVRAAGGVAGNVAIGQGLAGAEAAAAAPSGERLAEFEKAFNTVDGANAALAAGLGFLGAKPLESLKAIAREATANRTRTAQPEIPIAEAAVSRARTVAPRTADALQAVVDESLPPPAVTARANALRAAMNPELRQQNAAAGAQENFVGGTFPPEALPGATEVTPIAPGSPESALASTPATPEVAPEVTPEVTIAGPALTTPEGAVLAEGKVGDTHASLTGEALPKYLDANPEADPSSMVHQFRGSDGSVIPRDKAWDIAKAAGQIKPDVLAYKEAQAAKPDGKPPELHSQDLQGAPFSESPKLPTAPVREVPPVLPARPLPEPAPPPTPREVAAANRLTPEERSAKIESGTTDTRAEVEKTGLVPSVAELRGRLANDAKAAGALHAELTADVAKKYPPEALPAGAAETTTKSSLTGDQLPSVNEGGKLRPKFTNDPNLTAQQIDNGSVGTDKANRLYVPDEIMDSDKLNPAIDTAYDKEAGKFYVSKVNSVFGEVAKPGDFEAPYRADKQLQKAHQLVLGGTPDEVQQIANRVAPEDNPVGQALVENGFAADTIRYEPDETDAPEGAVATPGSKVVPEQTRAAIDALKRVQILGPDGKPAPGAVETMLQAIADKQLPTFDWMRILAKTLLKSGIDLSKVEVEVVDRPNANYAGLYQYNPADVTHGKIIFNVGVGHEGGVLATALHELFHHASLVKIDPNYKRSPVEQRAYENLQTLFDHAAREIYKANFGKEGTPEEIAKFRDDQRAGSTADVRNRTYFGLTSLHEFVVEALSNPKFMKALQQIKGAPGIRVGSKIRDLLAAVRDALKTLFTGSTSRNATMDQVLDQSLQFIEAGAVEHARAAEVPYVAEAAAKKAEDLSQLSRADLETRAEAAGLEHATIMTMTQAQLRSAITGETPPEPTTNTITQDGWLGPDGKFHPAPMTEGGHESIATTMIHNDPALTKEFQAENGGAEISADQVYKFMNKRGFVRVIGGGEGGTIYLEGNPTRAQKQQLIDSAIEQKATLVQDFGGRSRTLFSPGDAFSAAGEPPSPSAPKITATETGHSVEIPKDATRTELQDAINSLEDPANGVKPEDKARIWNELTNALGPTISLQGPAAPGGPPAPPGAPPTAPTGAPQPAVPGGPTLTKRAASDRIVYGYDAINNIANKYGKEQANSVALDFGSSKNPTPEQTADRAAAPFVVEAGGNKEELVRDLMQVIHSKDPKLAAEFAPIIQHAIDNFDRLNATTQHYRDVTKQQLARERAAGVTTGELDNYVTRLLDQPNSEPVLPGAGSQGRSSYFMKGRKFEKLADAINAGFAPKTTDLVDLTQRRVESGERLVQQKLLEQELKTLNAPDGNPILGKMDEYESITGGKESVVPKGYSLVQTGGRPLVVNAELAPVFKALYGDSTINQALLKTAGFIKQNTLMFDTFHVGRIMFKELAYSKGGGRVGYNKGLSLLEYSPEDLQRAVKAGDINQSMADYANGKLNGGLTRREAAAELLKRGLNVGRVSDNLLAEHSVQLPFIKNFNPWVFQKLSRGAMIQTALENFDRNMARFPERGVEGNARQTAREYNEVFGNLQNQGLFTNKNYQDLARALVLAPNWAESQARAELRGYGQQARAVGELFTGEARLGTVAQGQLTVILGMLAANQIANYLSTGHSTFQNGEGHKLDAFIPGGNRGFWFNPMEIGGEYAHMAMRYFSQHQNPIDVAKQIASNKLGPVGRSATTLISGRDFAGRSFATTKDRFIGALTDLIPMPIGLSGTFERDPRQLAGTSAGGLPGLPGFRRVRRPGAAEQQTLQSVGLKVTPALSPTSEMFALAYPFRSDRSYTGPVEYRDLRSALDNKDEGSVQKELALLSTRGKTAKQITDAIGVGHPQKFTDSTLREGAFLKHLTPDQRALYDQAQKEHLAHSKALVKALRETPAGVKEKLRANTKPELPSP